MPPPVTEGAFYCVFTVCLNSEEVFGFVKQSLKYRLDGWVDMF